MPVEIPQRKAALLFSIPMIPRAGVTVESLASCSRLSRRTALYRRQCFGHQRQRRCPGADDRGQGQGLGIEPSALVATACAGVEPRVMGIGPVNAVRKLLTKTGLTIADLDLVEANEAFAVQSLAVTRELGWDPNSVNVNGGASALGHPIGASGARSLVTLIYEMKRRNARTGLATLCIGGGQGIAALVQR